ncbi:MAG: glycoside hydrolase family 3 N-terminal domain-containing protein, partial [Ginsengibacter sp.]
MSHYFLESKLFYLTTILCILQFSPTMAQQKNNTENTISEMVKKMTVEEKVGQMAQVSLEALGKIEGSIFVFDNQKLKDAVNHFKIGSILNSPGIPLNVQQWNAIIQQIENEAKETRMKIPLLYCLDDNHGSNYILGATLFPQEIGQAATWNRKLIYDAAVITAYESRAAGVPWTFSPVLDLGTNPQWPRIW